MKRRTVLKLFGVTGVTALAGHTFWIEPQQVRISYHNLSQHFAKLKQPGIPSGQVLKLVQISDIHIKVIDRFAHRVAAKVNQLKPDLILFTGDIVDRTTTLPILEEFLALIDQAPAKYAILGNWENHSNVDLQDLKASYAKYDCTLMINESIVHQHQTHRILLTGLDDTVEGKPNLLQALQDVEPEANHLILAHAPDQRDLLTQPERQALARFKPQLMLSGHTHGGQITFLGFAPILPRGSGEYIRGWYDDRAPQLYVSQGLGGSHTRARLGATPEIALFEWPLFAR
ncbi:metallophosphoesterase [filamentous cyanobacterium LEGE 11480]|uniref:Metallophosphoesterase n=1 Tax=Romeriopsis navalis LEGE 11480 TaxID=2777977 RepID=A0A928VIZ8_9CYAN|nr:metallophosphoesterase [Romeriopsis navalis]MBE9028628.1 metallophosphoesterase [Romeriopsis navalis LEGE 11480]